MIIGSVSEASEMDDSSGVEGDMDTTDIELPGVHDSSTINMHLISSYSIVYWLYGF